MLESRRNIYKLLCQKNIETHEVENNTVAVHIRSGDVYSKRIVNANYSQPPLSFYLNILKKYLDKKIYLVSEDLSSPILLPLTNWLKNLNVDYKIVGQKFYDAQKILLSCQILVLSRGTFVLPLLHNTDGRKIYIYGSLGVGGRLSDLYGNNILQVVPYRTEKAKLLDTYWCNGRVGRTLLVSN